MRIKRIELIAEVRPRMSWYEDKVSRELIDWERKMLKPPGLLEQASRKLGRKVNSLLPDKVQEVITAAVRSIVKTALFGAEYTPKSGVCTGLALPAADERARALISAYKKVAAAEGAGTGAGGLMLSAADFPLFIAIKMKLLFELAHAYGYRSSDFSERIFLLKTFQFAFSGAAKRAELLAEMKRWEAFASRWSSESEYHRDMDWEQFQQEYRDAIDFRKMLQLVPGIGAVAGAWANYGIMDELGETGMQAYRLRRLADMGQR